MVLILSEENDTSTNLVLDHFIHNKKLVKRHNGENQKQFGYISLFINDLSFSIKLEQGSIKLTDNKSNKELDITSVWFRRPYSGVNDFNISLNSKDSINSESAYRSILNNYKIFKDYLFNNIVKKSLGSYNITGLNKIKTLSLAKGVGLTIPKTIITNNREEVVRFLSVSSNGLICKAIHEAFHDKSYLNEGFWISNKTTAIYDINDVPDSFGPSIFQENIFKEYEIRTFYLNGEFFSSCIFSQNNEKTKIDFRNYDEKKPNRMVPYKLPKEIQNQIKKLMELSKLNTGSIDFIKNKKGQYIFLEINPVGQFDFVSKSCNFNIDKRIYNYLSNE
ncbi:grasp-with-spasm system ATP-grasp peptide maturase [Tenacibaculum sp. 1B UA]|uniref:grasp-with-spasm system ATP-grasp peptide maturase n=1 Tax=Tenacibaculum sp. 1B UA TaxID=2922252 RepID=UPI002A23B9D6|nr:grasp-with-spasm system ATP-grasp peptide maturase [Tenacibaculum sp. 1B UA]MDX8554359.1 grasp-with-spasm system ATP-grasp peptide maturase [Tenacibaculum sp. 1B UA]